MINSNLSHISHRLAIVLPWQTDGRQPWQQLDRYLKLKIKIQPRSQDIYYYLCVYNGFTESHAINAKTQVVGKYC